MLTPRSLLAVALIVTGAFASDLLARGDPVIITVSTDGTGDYSKIQDAVDNASAGAIVRIGKGTWHEAVTVTQPLTLEGADWDLSRIVAASPGQDSPGQEQASPELVEGLERISRELDTETQAKLRQAFLKVFSSSPAVTVRGTTGVSIRNLSLLRSEQVRKRTTTSGSGKDHHCSKLASAPRTLSLSTAPGQCSLRKNAQSVRSQND